MFRRCSADVPQGPACSAGRGKAGLLVHLGLPPSRLGSRSFPYRWDMPSSHCYGPGRWLLLALPLPLPDFIGGPGLGGAGCQALRGLMFRRAIRWISATIR